MAEQLQELLDRIQKDGIDKAESNATRIEDEAKAKADSLIAKAKDDAKQIIEKAEKDGELFAKRGKNALEQAARDVILSVGDAVNRTLTSLVDRKVNAVLTDADFAQVIKSVIEAYCQAKPGEADIELLLPEDQQEKIADFLMNSMSEEMKKGLTISGNKNVISGFSVSLKDKGIQHDFTGEAVTDALSKLLRPHLAEIVKAATVKEKS